jgi:membrane associated rhomboid family serine protease
VRIVGIGVAVAVAGFVAGSIVSWLIDGVPYYRESAISGLIVGGLMAWQLYRNDKGKGHG